MITGLRPIALFMGLLMTGRQFTHAQFNFDSLLSVSPSLKQVAKQKEKYHLQIIYSHYVDSSGHRRIKHFQYNVSPGNYLYCASLVKLPVAVLCLKKMNDLALDIHEVLLTDSSRTCHRKVNRDSTSEDGWPTISGYIRKMMLVSDNEAYNRCFEFLGADYIHKQLSAWTFPGIRIVNRYELTCAPGMNRFTNPIRICDRSGKVLYTQKEEWIDDKWCRPVYKIHIGKAYKDFNNRIVNQPKDFSNMNYMSLEDSHRFLEVLLSSKGAFFGLSLAQYEFLESCMSELPVQSASPKYSRDQYPDTYKKYLFFEEGQDLINDSNFVSTNVVGLSYGFISDCARIRDRKNGIEFFLSAGLYVNRDGVLNDGKYDYQTVGRPFLTELGKQIHKLEVLHK